MTKAQVTIEQPGRLLSLDLFRGLVMFLLIAEGAGVYNAFLNFTSESEGGLIHSILIQFHHHPWNGLRFWDLIQPSFMFIVGVSMVYSISKRFDRGDSWNIVFKHIAIRCLILLAFGTGLHCIYAGEMIWILRNVLAQLSVTILITFLIFRLPWKQQLAISIGLILISDLTYRVFPVEGFNHPYTPDENFGTWMDNLLRNPISPGHWVAINCIPTAAHTIWGSLTGQLLKRNRPQLFKLKTLAIAGAIGLVTGYLINWGFGSETLRIPIIKRISTGSFVLASGGWCFLLLALFYYATDIRGWRPGWLTIINVAGTNSIFIYLVANTLAGDWIRPNVHIFSNGIFGSIGLGENGIAVITALVCWFILWYLCYWLYQRKIFLRI
jgi:predicted acyltransferase